MITDLGLDSLPVEQHGSYRWWKIEELLTSSLVHQHTKDYFLE